MQDSCFWTQGGDALHKGFFPPGSGYCMQVLTVQEDKASVHFLMKQITQREDNSVSLISIPTGKMTHRALKNCYCLAEGHHYISECSYMRGRSVYTRGSAEKEVLLVRY